MTEYRAINQLRSGTSCLWVGAGVGLQLANSEDGPPTWSNLVVAMEQDAGLVPPPALEFSARLDAVLTKFGRIRFQRELRKRILIPLASSITEQWKINDSAPPQNMRVLAQLGVLANPIVNFNVETLTSGAVVAGTGPWNPIVFKPPVPDAMSSSSSTRHCNGRRHLRRVYHPHGALDTSGICVMSDREYRAMNGTLALQIAVHSAFGLDLVIVGMSLDDRYLREQLEQFRAQIRTVTWVTDQKFPEDEDNETRAWCYRSGITIEHVEWSAFWDAIEASSLPLPDPSWLRHDWLQLVRQAYRELGNPMTEGLSQTDTMMRREGWPVDSCSVTGRLWAALMRGETPVEFEAWPSIQPDEQYEDDLAELDHEINKAIKSVLKTEIK